MLLTKPQPLQVSIGTCPDLILVVENMVEPCSCSSQFISSKNSGHLGYGSGHIGYKCKMPVPKCLRGALPLLCPTRKLWKSWKNLSRQRGLQTTPKQVQKPTAAPHVRRDQGPRTVTKALAQARYQKEISFLGRKAGPARWI